MLLAGKLAGWGVVGAVHPGGLVQVVDNNSGASFLVDTGSTFSIMPFSSNSPPTGPLLRSANGHKILCWGKRRLTICFGGRRYSWTFLLAAVDFHIIGVDFLRNFSLLVDVVASKLLMRSEGNFISASPATTEAVQAAVVGALGITADSSSVIGPQAVPVTGPAKAVGVKVPSGSPAASHVTGRTAGASSTSPPPQWTGREADILEEFADVLNAEGRLPPSTHGVEHHIVTSGRPVTAKFRRLDSAKLAAAKKEFQQLEKEGIVRRSNSDWASPLHMVQKSDGSWRPCGDFRRLNAISDTDCYPLPNMVDITSGLSGNAVFSKLDLKKGYHQIPVNPADIKKTAIITPFGLFEFLRMPFGLKNAGMTFQRFMDRVMAGLDFVLVYLDDILVASHDRRSHAGHLRQVLERLRDNGLVLNRAKCKFFCSEVEFLGLRVTAGGVPCPHSALLETGALINTLLPPSSMEK